MVKIKFIKDTEKGYKLGDIVKCSKSEAQEIITDGYAEYVKEPENKKTKGDITQEAAADAKEEEKGDALSTKQPNPQILMNEEKEPKDETSFLGISKFNTPTSIFTPKDGLVYQNETYADEDKSFGITYNIYKVLIGAGNKPKFIYCDVNDKVEIGDSQVYLTPLSIDEVKEISKDLRFKGVIVEFTEKHAKIKITKRDATLEDYEEALINKHNKIIPLFFKKRLAIPLEELKSINDFYLLAKTCLSSGIEIGDEILDAYISQIPEVNPSSIQPSTYMKSANHSIVLTNPGTGKTTTARAVTGEPTIIDCSSANLLGYSTSDTRVSGRLDKGTKAAVIEEIQEFSEEEVLGQLLTYQEQGECTRAKGMGISCRGFRTLVYQGNPKIKREDDEGMFNFLMLKCFRDFLVKISKNTKAFSRRIGELEIGIDYKVVTGAGINEEQLIKANQILRTIAEGFKNEYTRFIKNEKIFEWINKDYETEFIEKIEKLSKSCPDDLIKQFIEGQSINNRHLRGGAVKRAWLQKGISKVINKGNLSDDDLDEILDTAEIHYENRKIRNIKSIAAILDLTQSPEYHRILEGDLKNIKPEYAKLLIFSLFSYKIEGHEDKIIPITLLEENFERLKTAWNVSGKYQYLSRIIEPFETHINQFKSLLENFGLDYDKSGSMFIIKDAALFNKKIYSFKNIMGTEGTTSTKGTEGTTSTDSTKGTKHSADNQEGTIEASIVPIVPCTSGTKGFFSAPDLLKSLKILENKIGQLMPIEEIYRVAPGIEKEQVDNLLIQLKKKGLVFEPRDNYFQLVDSSLELQNSTKNTTFSKFEAAKLKEELSIEELEKLVGEK